MASTPEIEFCLASYQTLNCGPIVNIKYSGKKFIQLILCFLSSFHFPEEYQFDTGKKFIGEFIGYVEFLWIKTYFNHNIKLLRTIYHTVLHKSYLFRRGIFSSSIPWICNKENDSLAHILRTCLVLLYFRRKHLGGTKVLIASFLKR